MENFTIDRENKSFVFDDGEVIPIPKEKQKQVLRSKAAQKSKQESIEKWQQWEEKVPLGESGHTFLNTTSENIFGNLGDTAANYAVSAIKSFSPGEGQEKMGYIDRVLDHFYAMQEGRKEHLSELQKRNPKSTGAGKVTGLIGELGTLYGVPGAIALPAMGAGASETSFLDIGEKSKEVGKDIVTGLVLDKFFKGLSNVAGHRETQRGIKNLISGTEEANLAEIQRAAGATEADKIRFANQAAAREAEIGRLSSVQQAENQTFRAANQQSMERIAKTMGKNSLPAEMLGVEDFISSAIDTSAHAATSEANYTSRFLRSIFKGDKSGKVTGESLKKGMAALDEAILKNEGTVKDLLVEYKNVLAQSLPERLSSAYVFEKWAPKIAKSSEALEKNLGKIFESSPDIHSVLSKRLGADYSRKFNESVQKTIQDTLGKYKNNFQTLDSALVGEEIAQAVKSSPFYQKMMKQVDTLFPQLKQADAFKVFPQYQVMHTSLVNYPEILAQRVTKNINNYAPDIGLDFASKGGITQTALQKAPNAPNMLAPPAPVAPAQAVQPNLTPVPEMPQARGVYAKLASGLETLRDTGPKAVMTGVKENVPSLALAKLAGIPLTKAAVGAAVGATGLRALTSPSVGGQVLRTGLEQSARGGFAIVNQLAQKYPSYHDGIVEDPQERRSLTKEIENISEMPIEEKAIFQSKVNRGKPIQDRL